MEDYIKQAKQVECLAQPRLIASAPCTAMMSTAVVVVAVCPSTPVSPPAKQKRGSFLLPLLLGPAPAAAVPFLSVPIMAGAQALTSCSKKSIPREVKGND